MNSSLKLLLVVGTRPNFPKIAPFIRAIHKWNTSESGSPTLEYTLLHTGQHYDPEMSGVFFQELAIPEPHIYLNVGSGSHGEQTAKVLVEVEKVLQKQHTDLVVVVGDVNSTLAAALAAAKLHVPVAHIEAGLRSFDRLMPEEINRLLTDAISDYLFTTSEEAEGNLLREGIPREKVFFVGNVMIDNLRYSQGKLSQGSASMPFGLDGREYAVVTLHRPSNVDSTEVLLEIMGALLQIAEQVPMVFPVHPRTAKAIANLDVPVIREMNTSRTVGPKGIHITGPMAYLELLQLMQNARLVLTDSGGIQEETTALGIPCLTLRDTTERPITVSAGTNKVIGNNSSTIVEEASKILNSDANDRGTPRIPPLWDGKAAERIVRIIAENCVPLAQ